MNLIYKNICLQQNQQRGQPKYYAMFGGATGESDTTSGTICLLLCLILHIDLEFITTKLPTPLFEFKHTTYISQYFPNGLLYCCLVRSIWLLKGPADMLTLYENKYKQEIEKFASRATWKTKKRRLHRRNNTYTDYLQQDNRRLNYGNIISNMFKF